MERMDIVSVNTAVVGAGAAALNAADRLYDFGQKRTALVCEDLGTSTSRNAGSDKQTYYKLTLSGAQDDSVRALARTFFSGQCVDGDNALAEAAMSAGCFLRLCSLGVPFPTNRYGEYIGYKTDHDPNKRATSAGPLTSKLMTECLLRSVRQKGIDIFEGYQVISILRNKNAVAGLLCIRLNRTNDGKKRYALFNCRNVVYATGGPAGMYRDSVYPYGQYGASGIAFLAGASGQNLTEWQYGLASVSPRWNVSGSYMQVIPAFVSTEQDGSGGREFLKEHIPDPSELFLKTFLKGYQWPFDVRKADGSSVLDLLVHNECFGRGRKVFLDFTRNPRNFDPSLLPREAYEYLDKAGALSGTPVERLIRLNAPAYELYLDKGVDLRKEPLEIALCAQHNNGGLAVDCWWQTDIEGFFAVGEVAGVHGVYRPGGSALNSGQVGSERAARYIARKRSGDPPSADEFFRVVKNQVMKALSIGENALCDIDTVSDMLATAQERMSRAGAAVRDSAQVEDALGEVRRDIDRFAELAKIRSEASLPLLYRLYDVLVSQYVYLSAMQDYIGKGGKSRGSALYGDRSGSKPGDDMPELFRHLLDNGTLGSVVQQVRLGENGTCEAVWRNVRPIPDDDDFFENVWRRFREDGNVF